MKYNTKTLLYNGRAVLCLENDRHTVECFYHWICYYYPAIKATENSLSGIPGNCYVLNSRREFPKISEIMAEITGDLS